MQKSNALGEYRKIQAPQQLRERVFASCEELSKSNSNITKLNITKISSAAACFVAVFALVLTLALSGAPKLSHDGENIRSQTAVSGIGETAAFSARTTLPSGIEFELDISSPSVIRVSGGTLYLIDSETYETIASGFAVYAKEDALLIWDIVDETFDELTLSITSSGSEKNFSLALDESGELCISKK